jgi:hypothetical protein
MGGLLEIMPQRRRGDQHILTTDPRAKEGD